MKLDILYLSHLASIFLKYDISIIFQGHCYDKSGQNFSKRTAKIGTKKYKERVVFLT